MRGFSRDSRRVVVTGLGCITPLGSGVERFWEKLCAGESGVRPITRFDPVGFRTRIAAEVTECPLPPTVSDREWGRLDRFAQFGLAAAVEAWYASCLSQQRMDPYEVGVILGSSHGGEETLLSEMPHVLERQSRKISARLIPRMLSNSASAHVAIHLGLHGPSFTLGSACATGGHAIGEGAEIIRRGDATVMLCGAAEAAITPLTLAGDQAAGALSSRNDEPMRASRPFDVDRDGFVLGEGAGVLVLEERNHALARRARIYAEVSGYGLTSDALHETRPDPLGTGAAHAIRRALTRAGLTARDVDGVFAHATGTRLGDPAEVRALQNALGDRAAHVPVTAIKSTLGHLLGASGAVQAVAAVKALQTGVLPPTVNLERQDPECNLQVVVDGGRKALYATVLSNSFGFGGHNVALIFSSAQ